MKTHSFQSIQQHYIRKAVIQKIYFDLSLAVRLVLWRSWRRSVVTLRFGKPSLIWVVCRPWCPSWTLLTKSWSAWLQRPSPMWPSSDGPAGWSDNMVASRDWWEKWNLVLCAFVKTGWLWLKSCIRKGDKRIKCMLKVHTCIPCSISPLALFLSRLFLPIIFYASIKGSTLQVKTDWMSCSPSSWHVCLLTEWRLVWLGLACYSALYIYSGPDSDVLNVAIID